MQRACAVSYWGRHQGHPPTQSTSVANVGGYLDGVCGEKDPIEDDDCKRVSEGHCSPESQPRAEAGSKDARPADDNSQKSCVPGASGDTTGGKPRTSSKMAVGGQKRSNLSLRMCLSFFSATRKKVSHITSYLFPSEGEDGVYCGQHQVTKKRNRMIFVVLSILGQINFITPFLGPH